LTILLVLLYLPYMNYLATITSKRQLTIPADLYKQLVFQKGQKVLVYRVADGIKIEPKKDFWQLSAGMKSKIKLTDKQLRQARDSFTRAWAKE